LLKLRPMLRVLLTRPVPLTRRGLLTPPGLPMPPGLLTRLVR
jgi:hypothetical protein